MTICYYSLTKLQLFELFVSLYGYLSNGMVFDIMQVYIKTN